MPYPKDVFAPIPYSFNASLSQDSAFFKSGSSFEARKKQNSVSSTVRKGIGFGFCQSAGGFPSE